jgi:hypothetical protein
LTIEHPEQGDQAFVTAGLLALMCITLCVYQTFGDRIRERTGWTQRYRLPFDETSRSTS